MQLQQGERTVIYIYIYIYIYIFSFRDYPRPGRTAGHNNAAIFVLWTRHRKGHILNFWRRIFFLILAHTVYKM